MSAASSASLVVNGSVSLLPPRIVLAGMGKAFVATNPTPGTAIAYANKTSFSATANGLFTVSNNNSIGSNIDIVLDEIMLLQTATAPANVLVSRFEVYLEASIVALTGAAAARTPVNLYPLGPSTTGAVVTSFAAGAGTVAAAVGARRLIGIGSIGGAAIIHDEWVLQFGQEAKAKNGGAAVRAADAAREICSLPACVIPPGHTAIINNWTLTGDTNVPSYEFAVKYFEL